MMRRHDHSSKSDAADVPLVVDAAIEEIAASWVARRDAGLNAADERELQNWLRADRRHVDAFESYATAWSALDRPVQAGAGNALLRELNVLNREVRRRYALVTAAASVILISAIVAWDLVPRRNGPTATSQPTARVISPMRQSLPDGSIVDVKAGGKIREDYTPELRRVTLLQGEAHFQVQKDAARPFIVSAGDVEVRAVGTAFAVQLGQRAVEVIVTEGNVALDQSLRGGARPVGSATNGIPNSTGAHSGSTFVSAGKRAVVGLNAAPPEVREIPSTELSKRLNWRVPRLEFSGTPLFEAAALLNQHVPGNARKFVIEDPAVGQVRISGLFRADNTAAFVDLLETAFGISSVSRNGTEMLLQRER